MSRSSLLAISKTFIRSRLDYADIIYDQAFKSNFHNKLESVQYNTCPAINGAIGDTSIEKLYQELGLEYLKSRDCFRKLCYFCNSMKNHSYIYLIQYLILIGFIIPGLAKTYLQ